MLDIPAHAGEGNASCRCRRQRLGSLAMFAVTHYHEEDLSDEEPCTMGPCVQSDDKDLFDSSDEAAPCNEHAFSSHDEYNRIRLFPGDEGTSPGDRAVHPASSSSSDDCPWDDEGA